MLKRFSSTFRKRKKSDGSREVHGAKNAKGASDLSEGSALNGTKAIRTNDNGAHTEREKIMGHQEKAEIPDHSAERSTVVAAFEEFAQSIHATRRPVPNQASDGIHTEKEAPGGLLKDLRSMGLRDFKTLKSVMYNKSKGELIDDKTYLMERVIQVNCQDHMPRSSANY
jgi:hypothetical protein